ncbi:hypothetical protein MKC66_17890 [[Clostridium] innocuum]|nr:hypothetical protein [[Clostridium] innocuum]
MDRNIQKDMLMHALYEDYTQIIFLIPDIKNAVDRAEEIARYQKILKTMDTLELTKETMIFLSGVSDPLKEISSYMEDGSELESALIRMMTANRMKQDVIQI